MKKRFRRALILCIIMILFICFSNHKKIDQTVPATVFVNDTAVSETVIEINGDQRLHLQSSELTLTYVGSFEIEYYERSCRPGTKAKIKWLDDEVQYITFFQGGNSSFLDIEKIIIDEQMSEIAVALSDGTIIATSEHALQKCRQSL